MSNPYFCYVASFIVALFAYALGWSELYPALTFPLLLFLGGSIVIFIVLGIIVKNKNTIRFRAVAAGSYRYHTWTTVFIYFLWCIEFLHAGGIPLLKILFKQPFDYRYFGVPSLHVFVVTFSSFYTIYLFHIYLSHKGKLILGLYIINLLAAILIYNRGMLLFNLSATFCLYVMYKQTVTIKQAALLSVAVIMLFFLFGVLGSLRVSRMAQKPYSNYDFLLTGRASQKFKTSIVPDEFFWSYIYISSPLANLQHNINTYQPRGFSAISLLEWFNNEVLFDFISKRINSVAETVRESEHTIPGPFNVSTIYSRSFSYLGWLGMVLMTVVIMLLPLLLAKAIPSSSRFFLTAIAILNTMFLFMIFDNTLRFTGLSFQLIYPITLHATLRYVPYLGKFF